MKVMTDTTVHEETVIETVSDEEGARRERLLRAAEIIEERGWIRSFGYYEEERHCILGAVWWAGHEGVQRVQVLGLSSLHCYAEAASVVGCGPYHNATNWNDERAKGGAQVTRALRRLANGATWEEAIS